MTNISTPQWTFLVAQRYRTAWQRRRWATASPTRTIIQSLLIHSKKNRLWTYMECRTIVYYLRLHWSYSVRHWQKMHPGILLLTKDHLVSSIVGRIGVEISSIRIVTCSRTSWALHLFPIWPQNGPLRPEVTFLQLQLSKMVLFIFQIGEATCLS